MGPDRASLAQQTVHPGLTSYGLAAFILRFRVVTTMFVWQMQLDFSCKSSDLRGIDVDKIIGEYSYSLECDDDACYDTCLLSEAGCAP